MKKLIFIVTLFFASPAFSAACFISEYGNTGADSGGRQVEVAVEPAITTQAVTYTSSTASAAFNSQTKFIRIICDAKAHFVFGTAPTATSNSPFLTSSTAEYFAVIPGYKVAVYDGSS